MSLNAPSSQTFDIPVTAPITARQKINSALFASYIVVFALTLVYTLFFGNFLALEFAEGETYSAWHFWFLFLNVIKIAFVALAFFGLGKLRTMPDTGMLGIAIILAIFVIIWDVITIVWLLLISSRCVDTICFGGPGGSGISGVQTTQFQMLLWTTVISLVIEIVFVVGANSLKSQADKRAERLTITAPDEMDSGLPATEVVSRNGLLAQQNYETTGPGLGQGAPVIDPNRLASDQQFANLTPAAQNAMLSGQRQGSIGLQQPHTPSLAEVIKTQRNLSRLSSALDVAMIVSGVVYALYFGNFLALEFDANETYGSSFRWWALWINVYKLPVLGFSFFVISRGRVSKTITLFTVLMVIAVVSLLYNIFCLVIYLVEIDACDARLCYGLDGNTGVVGERSFGFIALLFLQVACLIIDLLVVIGAFFMRIQIPVRNTALILNSGPNRTAGADARVTRRLAAMGLTMQPAIDAEIGDVSSKRGASNYYFQVGDELCDVSPNSAEAYTQLEVEMGGGGGGGDDSSSGDGSDDVSIQTRIGARMAKSGKWGDLVDSVSSSGSSTLKAKEIGRSVVRKAQTTARSMGVGTRSKTKKI